MPASAEEKRQKHYTQQKTLLGAISNKAKYYGRSTLHSLLAHVRKGPETVLIPPPVARGGNWLYEWLAAYTQGQAHGASVRLKSAPGMDEWLAEFPRLKELTTHPADIKFTHIRKIGFHQDVKKNFLYQECKDFICTYLLASEQFSHRVQAAQQILSPQSIVVNIRRGDYYSNPVIHHDFGIDTVGYITQAIQQATKEKPADTIVVTSDDITWCKQNLKFLKNYGKVIFDKENPGPFTDLAFVAASQRIILTNTTFGYWGGYIASFTQDARVWVPTIHERANLTDSRERPMQHLDSWVAVAPPLGRATWLEDNES